MAFSIGGLLSGIASILPGVGGIIKAFTKPSRPPSQAGPTVRRAAAVPAIPFIAAGVRGIIGGLLGRASAAIGKRMTRQSVVSLINALGLTAAAAALGLSIEEAAQIFASTPKRRRRGITARDIRTTKRVVGFTRRIQHDLGHLAGPIRRSPRRHHHHKT